MTLREAIAIVQTAHPFHWKGTNRVFFDEEGKQVFQCWKNGELLYRITEDDLEEAFVKLYEIADHIKEL